jgi:hypothetical protein
MRLSGRRRMIGCSMAAVSALLAVSLGRHGPAAPGRQLRTAKDVLAEELDRVGELDLQLRRDLGLDHDEGIGISR